MKELYRIARSSDALQLYKWRLEVARNVPLNTNIPLEEQVEEKEIIEEFDTLSDWITFYMVLNYNNSPFGWIEIETVEKKTNSGQLQGWFKAGDYKRRLLYSKALYRLIGELFMKTSIQSFNVLISTKQRDLIESYLLSGFRITGLRSDYYHDDDLVLDVLSLYMDKKSYENAPGKWCF